MTEVEYSAELLAGMAFQNVEGGSIQIVGARYDADRRSVVFAISGSALPPPKKVRAIVRQESDGKFFTRFVAD